MQTENIIVIFGATGDLMSRKISSALYALHQEGNLENTNILGFARRSYSDEDFHNHLREPIQKKTAATEENLQDFFRSVNYISGEFSNPESFDRLTQKIKELTHNECETRILFYLSVSPEHYEDIIRQVGRIKPVILEECEQNDFRLLVEKPIGTDKESALHYEEVFSTVFTEEQIYRIDHYLHKKSTKNIFAFRFLNKIFQPSWDNQTIERIEIVTNEDLEVKDRGSFYDTTGTLRDVGQNHLLELLALLTMKKPESFSAKDIAKSRSEAIKKIRCLKNEDVSKMTYRAQYKGFRDIDEVSDTSETETFFKIKTAVDTHSWYNVPITLQAGKALGRTQKYVKVVFRKDIGQRFDMTGAQHIQNQIIFNFPPKEYINIEFSLFADSTTGLSCEIRESETMEQYIEEYKEVITGAIKGDKTWFVTKEEVVAGWEFVDPIVKAWKDNKVKLDSYDIGSDEPVKSSMWLDEEDSQVNAVSVGQQALADLHGNGLHDNKLKKQIGVIGLGKMGGGIARNLLDHGWEVVANNRSPERIEKIKNEGALPAYTIKELVEKLERPRKIWIMVPSGAPVDDTLFGENGLINYLDEEDIVIDAGNSFFRNSVERGKKLSEKGVRFIDAGVSGGPSGARNGACIMIGGEKQLFEYTETIFRDLSLPGGYKFFEGMGAGHFVKMVHNGIEYGIMQAIAEGFGLMKESDYELDLKKITEVYNRGSVIESRLIGWLLNAYEEHSTDLNGISGEVKHSGEGQWTVEIAKSMNIPVKVIEDALQFRIDSTGNPSYIGQVVSALRNQFGGHEVADNN